MRLGLGAGSAPFRADVGPSSSEAAAAPRRSRASSSASDRPARRSRRSGRSCRFRASSARPPLRSRCAARRRACGRAATSCRRASTSATRSRSASPAREQCRRMPREIQPRQLDAILEQQPDVAIERGGRARRPAAGRRSGLELAEVLLRQLECAATSRRRRPAPATRCADDSRSGRTRFTSSSRAALQIFGGADRQPVIRVSRTDTAPPRSPCRRGRTAGSRSSAGARSARRRAGSSNLASVSAGSR